jgi:hypothetical protein
MKMALRISRFILFLFGTMFLFAGCTTKQAYEGSKLPRESVAVIKPTTGPIDQTIIVKVDGVDGKKRVIAQEIFEVLPGEHTVVVRAISGFFPVEFVRYKTLSFKARAGRVYRVEGKVRDGNAIVWIEDETTNEVVAGEKQ